VQTKNYPLLFVIIFFLSSCGGAPPPNLQVPPECKAGQTHFHKVCSNCHGPDALSQGSFKAPKLIDAEYLPGNFSDDDIRDTINNGTDKMPSQRSKFNKKQIEEIIKYLRYSQKAAGLSEESEDDSEEDSEEE
jgi:mono/diheme cytochrome c family protein